MSNPNALTADLLISRASALDTPPSDELIRAQFAVDPGAAEAFVNALFAKAERRALENSQALKPGHNGVLALRGEWTSKGRSPKTYPMLCLFSEYDASKFLADPTSDPAKISSKATLSLGRTKARLVLDAVRQLGNEIETWLEETA